MGKKTCAILLALLFAAFFLPPSSFATDKEQEAQVQELFSQGVDALNQGHPNLALEKFTAALKLDPELPEAYINRGIALRRLEQYVEAVEDFDQALKLTPQSPEALYNRGLAYSLSGLYDKAVADYTQALKYAPQDWQIFYNRGNAYLDQGKSGEALKDYNQALKFNPRAPEAYLNRGLACLDLKEPGQALADADKALELNPHFARANYVKAQALEQSGRKPEAMAAYRRFLETGHPEKDRDLMQKALDQLQKLEGKDGSKPASG
jgi:tetratricopeptide (TPR) repeat protein